VNQIFQGKPGKVQKHTQTFRRMVCKLLDTKDDLKIAVSWCPGHSGIEGNEGADDLAKMGARLSVDKPEHHTLSFIESLHKRNMEEEWRGQWNSTPNPDRSGFRAANQIPPSIKPTERLKTLGQKAFSRLIQFRTGHAHIGEYYNRFGIQGESGECACGAAVQTREHILQVCPLQRKFRHLLGRGRQTRFSTLMGTRKGVLRLAEFLKKT
jgi:hypothetical protein